MKKQRNYRVRPPQLTVIEKLHQLLCPMKYRLISVAYTSASTKFPKCLLLCISYSQSNLSHFVLHISIYWGCGVSSSCRIVMEDILIPTVLSLPRTLHSQRPSLSYPPLKLPWHIYHWAFAQFRFAILPMPQPLQCKSVSPSFDDGAYVPICRMCIMCRERAEEITRSWSP